MPEMPALHVHALGDGFWGVYSPVAGNGPRLLARCGGPDAEANARLFASATALRKAAEPFAEMARFFLDDEGAASLADRVVLWADKPDWCLTYGDLRALKEASGER